MDGNFQLVHKANASRSEVPSVIASSLFVEQEIVDEFVATSTQPKSTKTAVS